jgi:hypothetical protein
MLFVLSNARLDTPTITYRFSMPPSISNATNFYM